MRQLYTVQRTCTGLSAKLLFAYTQYRLSYDVAHLLSGSDTNKTILQFFVSPHDTPGRVEQSVTCLVTDAKLTADPGVASSIPARSHTFVEIDHEIISTVILLPSAESFMKGCCQLQAKVCARLLVNCLFKLAQEKKCG